MQGKASPELVRAMGAFGGGLAGTGEVCGAVVGALAAIGLAYSRSAPEEKEDFQMWVLGNRFLKRFRAEAGNGSIYCRDIAQTDWRDSEQKAKFYGSEKYFACRDLTANAARILGELLEESEAARK